MDIKNIIDVISSVSPFSIIKIFVLILLFLYVLFAAIVFRQVELMTHVLEAKFSPMIRILAIVHLALIVLTFFLALVGL